MKRNRVKDFLKWLGNRPLTQKAIGTLAALFLWSIYKTCRFRRIGFDYADERFAKGLPVLGTIWHARVVFSPFAVDSGKSLSTMYALVSRHRDGRMIAETVKALGIKTIDGSTNTRGVSSKGGVGAAKEVIRRLGEGSSVMICPDGPRGPAFKMPMGPLFIAKESGLPLLPTAISAARARIFNTWDRFMLPLPFSRGVFMAGEPMPVPKDASDDKMELLRQAYEKRMNDLMREADRQTGRIKE